MTANITSYYAGLWSSPERDGLGFLISSWIQCGMRDWLIFNILILEENASVTCRKGTLDVLVVSLALGGCTISSPGRGSCFSLQGPFHLLPATTPCGLHSWTFFIHEDIAHIESSLINYFGGVRDWIQGLEHPRQVLWLFSTQRHHLFYLFLRQNLSVASDGPELMLLLLLLIPRVQT